MIKKHKIKIKIKIQRKIKIQIETILTPEQLRLLRLTDPKENVIRLWMIWDEINMQHWEYHIHAKLWSHTDAKHKSWQLQKDKLSKYNSIINWIWLSLREKIIKIT